MPLLPHLLLPSVHQMCEAQPTFSWMGVGRQEGSRIYYTSFNFSGEPYALGDCVYLLPEEEGAPPYIAKLLRAWEDTRANDAEKLIIEVSTGQQGGQSSGNSSSRVWLLAGQGSSSGGSGNSSVHCCCPGYVRLVCTW